GRRLPLSIWQDGSLYCAAGACRPCDVGGLRGVLRAEAPRASARYGREERQRRQLLRFGNVVEQLFSDGLHHCGARAAELARQEAAPPKEERACRNRWPRRDVENLRGNAARGAGV